jgi:hypothetical protein
MHQYVGCTPEGPYYIGQCERQRCAVLGCHRFIRRDDRGFARYCPAVTQVVGFEMYSGFRAANINRSPELSIF